MSATFQAIQASDTGYAPFQLRPDFVSCAQPHPAGFDRESLDAEAARTAEFVQVLSLDLFCCVDFIDECDLF